MKRLFLAFFLCARIVWAGPESVDEAVSYLRKSPERADLNLIPTAIRTAVIERLRSALPPDGDPICATAEKVALLRLGDQRTLEAYVNSLGRKVDPNGRVRMLDPAYGGYIHPSIIPKLSRFLMRNDGNLITYEPDDDVPYQRVPLSVSAADLSLAILRDSGSFSAEVRSWAAEMIRYRQGGPEPFNADHYRENVRRWWQQNARYFADGRFDAVGSGDAPGRRTQSQEQERIPNVTPAAPQVSASTRGPFKSPYSASPMPAEPSKSQYSSSWPYFAIALLLLLILPISIFIKKGR